MPLPWHYEDDVVRVRKVCVGPLENNVYIVACAVTGRAVIIDAADEADRIVAACADLEPVAILTTHGHHDHVGAATAVAERLGIPMKIHDADVALAGAGSWTSLTDGEVVTFGSTSITAIHVPGHTEGSTCFTSGPIVFSGDTLFPGGPGATGGDPDRFGRIMQGLRTSLFTMPDDTLVMPGHGLDTTIGEERPHLDEWQARGW